MANYTASSRSNYFRVKDTEAFRKWADDLELKVEPNDDGMLMIWADCENGDWPDFRFNEETDDYDEIAFYGELAEHLVPGEIAILMEVGAEKLRYLCGYAVAIDHEGNMETVSINQIYDKVKTRWPDVKLTTCEY